MSEKIKIIYEDTDLLVVDKPSGLTTTKEKRGEKGTLEDYLVEIRPNNLPRNGIVHRLDKGTSGLLLMAKNMDSWEDLKGQFKKREIKKEYICLVSGDVSMDGSIDWPIGRSKFSFGKWGVDVDGKTAITDFILMDKYRKNGKIYSLLKINLKTGRTHQIRVHMSHLRWPLVGDKLYGGKVNDLNRPFLHAFKLKFRQPKSGKIIELESKMPVELENVLKSYEKI